MTIDLNHPLFATADRYDQAALNAVISAYATNDDRLKDVVDALMLYYTTTSQPAGYQVQTPLQTKAEIDELYDIGNTAARVVPLGMSDPDRYYQEILNVLKVQPFSDLLIGGQLDAAAWVKVLRIFTMLKGLLYWVVDGPSYETDPVFVKDGSYFFTTISNSSSEYLLVDGAGAPLLVNGAEVFKPLPAGATISLMMFWLKRMEVQKLRTLFRIGAFEAGFDAKYSNDASYNFLDHAFVFDQTTPTFANQKTKRFPCGFTQAGRFRFLRDDVVAFTPVDNLAPLIPSSGVTGAGVEDRMVMDESFVQTPFGLIRIPRCLLSWGSLLSDNDRASDANGDPVVFVGLHLSVSLRETEPGQTTGEALPVSGNGFDDTTISPLEKNAEPTFPAQPFSGTQKQHMDVLSGYVYQHGTVIGFIQRNSAGPVSIPQFVQIQLNLVAKPLKAGTLATALAGLAQGTRDEVTKLEVLSSDLDGTPVRTMGLTPAIALAQVASGFAGYTLDTDQGILSKLATVVVGPVRTKTYEVVLPIALHLLKNSSPYSPSNLNGCATAFADAWAIRKVSSVQKHLGTVILADGTGTPEVFPNDFIGADVTFLAASGPTKGTIDGKIGDKLARLPSGVVDKLVAGDIVVIDRRVPEASLDGSYRGEVSARTLVDLRLRVVRLVDPLVETAGQFSPSPSPTQEQHALVRQKPRELLDAAVDCYATMEDATESKLRFDVSQKVFFKASNRHDRFDLRVGVDDLKGFLIQFVKDYDRNKAHRYTVGENVIIHWPSKAARTPVSLGRYPVQRIVDQQDELAIEDLPGWGPVPVVTKLLRASEHTRYPIRFDKALTFTSDRSFIISGHTKLAGNFFLRPSETQVYEPVVHVTLYQNRLVNGVTKRTFLGSVDFDYRYADSFKNADGIFRIDNDSRYDPTTQRVSIAYNQTVNFSTDEPGEITFASTYHDLSVVHPLWHWNPDQYGLEVSHLADATPLMIKDGAIVPVDGSPALTMRLEGISNNGGQVTVRWNRDDAFGITAHGQNGLLKTKWVVRGLPFVIIDAVTYDAAGVPTDVEYRALWVDRRQTITSQINSDARCRQTYTPCALKYAWVDLTQSNMHTEAVPFTVGGRFGFYELRDFLDTSGALRYGDAARTIFFMLEREPLDYRFTQPFDTSSSTGLEAISSVAILLNPKTKERRAVTGVFKMGISNGATVELSDELTLGSMDPHTTLFVRQQDLTEDWVLDFAGMLVTVHDHSGAAYDHKLAVVGYWYGVHGLVDRAAMTRTVGPDAVLFSTDLITKVSGNWRIGDLPGRHLYRDSNLLFTERKRPV